MSLRSHTFEYALSQATDHDGKVAMQHKLIELITSRHTLIYAAQVAATTGMLMANDQRPVDGAPVSLSNYTQRVHLNHSACDRTQRLCDFLQMPNPYSGMWVATREQVQRFVRDPLWTDPKRGPWKVREMASSGLQFVDLPEGFKSSALVPYDEHKPALSEAAAVYHVSNRYCANVVKKKGWCLTSVSDMLKP